MVKKRDGPAPPKTAPSQGQIDERAARLLPRTKIPRKSGAHPSSPHPRVRRRQSAGWRQFAVRIVTKPDSEGVHAMHVYLRTMARRFGLEIAEIDEIHEPQSND